MSTEIEEFSFTITRIAVSQICQSIGFKGAQNCALAALTDIATRYLSAAARLAATSANSSGRTQCNVLDIIISLQDLASVQGFDGLSCVESGSLHTSAVIKDLINFVEYTAEIPFAQPLPTFPVGATTKEKAKNNNNRDRCNGWYSGGSSWKHVPWWLPAIPTQGTANLKLECVLAFSANNNNRGMCNGWCSGGNNAIATPAAVVDEETTNCVERGNKERKVNISQEIETSERRGKVRFKMNRKRGWLCS